MTRLAVAFLAACTAAAAADPARADPDETPGCADLDVAEFERLLRIELAVVAGRVERARAPIVRITCEAGTLRVLARDATAKRTLTQSLTIPKTREPGRERALALAASQLLLSSWLEIVLESERAPKPAAAA